MGDTHYSLLKVQTLDAANSMSELARIDHFAKCTCIVRATHKQEKYSLWLVALSFFDEHSCKVWFGYPTEVWPTVSSLDMCYIPLSYIRSRVAYCSTSINFGRIAGQDTVYIVVPVD